MCTYITVTELVYVYITVTALMCFFLLKPLPQPILCDSDRAKDSKKTAVKALPMFSSLYIGLLLWNRHT